MPRMFSSLAAAVLYLSALPVLAAQEARGTIQGRVSDASGGTIPGATISVTSRATGIVTAATSNDEGNYRVPFLIPGVYRVEIGLSGFNKFVTDNLQLHVADTLTVDATLQVGQLTDQVEVSASASSVDQTSAGLGQIVDSRRISELPIREGSPVELVILAPGVTNTTDLRSRKAAFNNGLSQFSTDGSGEKKNDFTIDGVPNVAADRVAYSPPSAAVEEFKIHTTTYDAAIGNTMGAVVNLVTKSGSNKVKGQAYEWFRGAKLDAPQYFDKIAGRPKRHYDDNRFGAALGGPVIAGRTFYFGNVEANIWQGPQPVTLTVPTARMRVGDFSELLALGPQYQIYDPATIKPHPTIAGRFTRDPFPGNIIPANRIDPVARRILEFYPLPNQAATSDQRNNYTNPTAVAYETYYTATGRVDHNLSNQHRLYGRFSWDFWEEEKDDRFNNEATGIFLNRKNRIVAIDDTYTFRSNLLMNVRGGFTRQLFPERRRSQGFDLASLGFAPGLVSLVPNDLATFPNINFDNYQAFSSWESGDGYFTTDVYSAQGNLVWLIGNHSLKFGAENRTYIEDASRFPTSVSPRINFGTGWTRGPLDNSAPAPTGQDLASFLLGYPTGGDMSRSAAYTERSTVWGFYLHDDWRLRGNFTLNAGLRYEIEDPLTEKDGRMITGFDFNTTLPIAATATANYASNPIPELPVADFKVRGGLLYPDTGGRTAAWERRLSNFMPRLGFSWVPVEQTAVRGGYGLFYDVLGANRISANQVGYSRTTSLVPSENNGQTFVATLANPFPNGLLEPVGSALRLMSNVGSGVSFPYVGDARNPRSHRFSLGLQRELRGGMLIEATYVASLAEHLPVTVELNAVPKRYFSTSPVRDEVTNGRLTAAVANPFFPLLPGTNLASSTVQRQQLLRPYPQFTSIQALETNGTSDYHAFQGRVERRMKNGLTAQLAYTWSRLITETNYLNNFDTELERVIGAFDRTHIFVVSGLAEVPFGRGRRWGSNRGGVTDALLGGWQISAIFKAQSGAPLGFGNFLLAEGKTLNDIALSNPTRERWYNVDAFNRVTGQQLVSNVRTTPSRFADVRGPGYALLDLGLLKNVRIAKSAVLQLRLEAYNVLNRANFAGPNTNVTNSAAGTITAINGLPRSLQLAAKLSF